MNENPPSDGPRFLPQGIEVQLHHSRPRQLLGGRRRRPQDKQGTNLYIFGTLLAALEKALPAIGRVERLPNFPQRWGLPPQNDPHLINPLLP